MPRPRVLVLRAPGTNCDEETVVAWQKAGADAETLHISRVLESPSRLGQFGAITIPGGFSYGDDLGAGRIFAARLGELSDRLRGFCDRGGLIMGVCNGFQILVKAGLLPGGENPSPATITHNEHGRFECRWIKLRPLAGRTPFLLDDEVIELPVAHGEGRFLSSDGEADLNRLALNNQLVLSYCDEHGRPTQDFPDNPNGSPRAIAGLCDPTGRIFGLMPHPERHVDPYHHPRWTRRGARTEGDGLRIFKGAVAAMM
jgi:phosphoribosylformylglycinamidine synthase subunit PurQ / glutaminase